MALTDIAYIQELKNQNGDKIYPVTVSDAVYFSETDSEGIEKQTSLTQKISDMKTSFQDGVDTIVAKLTELGVTPEDSTPEGIAKAIASMYEDRYNAGVEQGHTDVKNNPNAYGLYSEDDYTSYGVAQYSAGIKYADNRVNTSSKSYEAGCAAGAMALNGTVSTTTGHYGKTVEEGNRAILNVWVTATAKIEKGVLSVSWTSNGSAQAANWEDDDFTNNKTASASGTGSAQTTVAA